MARGRKQGSKNKSKKNEVKKEDKPQTQNAVRGLVGGKKLDCTK